MNYRKMNWILLLATVVMALPSCNEELNLAENESESIELRDRDSRPPGQGGNNDNDVSRLKSTVTTEWADLFLKLDRYAYGMRPNATARAIAYINLAAYETAVGYMRSYESNKQRLEFLEIDHQSKPRKVDVQLALNACYADVLQHFMINVDNGVKEEIVPKEEALENQLSTGVQLNVIADSKAWGAYVAQQVITYSQTDFEAETQILEPQPLSYVPPTGSGYWTFSAEPERALFPYWGKVRSFIITPEETSSVAPLAYSSDRGSDYFAQMQEVYEINNRAKAEQNDELWVAEFWSDDVEGLMMSPPGRQVSIAKQLIVQKKLDLQKSLILMLKLGFALNDAAVSTWADKYEHMVMRPNVFIHDYIDETFQTNLYRLIYWANPSFPGYPSGHSCFASAAGGVFIDAFGNNVNFTDQSHEGRTEFLSRPRSFQTISEMAEENAFSRIPLGVHIRMDCTEGLRLGYEISDAVNNIKLKKDHI